MRKFVLVAGLVGAILTTTEAPLGCDPYEGGCGGDFFYDDAWWNAYQDWRTSQVYDYGFAATQVAEASAYLAQVTAGINVFQSDHQPTVVVSTGNGVDPETGEAIQCVLDAIEAKAGNGSVMARYLKRMKSWTIVVVELTPQVAADIGVDPGVAGATIPGGNREDGAPPGYTRSNVINGQVTPRDTVEIFINENYSKNSPELGNETFTNAGTFFHELMHQIEGANTHDDNVSEGERLFWTTSFSVRLRLAWQEVFGTPHPNYSDSQGDPIAIPPCMQE